jgi:hypothetical protein
VWPDRHKFVIQNGARALATYLSWENCAWFLSSSCFRASRPLTYLPHGVASVLPPPHDPQYCTSRKSDVSRPLSHMYEKVGAVFLTVERFLPWRQVVLPQFWLPRRGSTSSNMGVGFVLLVVVIISAFLGHFWSGMFRCLRLVFCPLKSNTWGLWYMVLRILATKLPHQQSLSHPTIPHLSVFLASSS